MGESKTGRGAKKAPDAELVASYAETNSVWATAKKFGMCGQSVHERLARLGVVTKVNVLSSEDRALLLAEYKTNAANGNLGTLAKRMGRTRSTLCRYAGGLGLTDKKHKRPYTSTWKYMDIEAARKIFGHFKSVKMGLGKYCKKHGYDDLGFATTMKKYFLDEWEHVIELKAPKTSLYKLGRAFEYRVRDHMKKFGYFVVRSPQSRSPVDLTCVRSGSIIFIQCKRGGCISTKDWNEFYGLAQSVGAEPILATMPDKSTRGIELRKITGPKDGTQRGQPWIDYSPRLEINIVPKEDAHA
jgi:Holliday junction resolvase